MEKLEGFNSERHRLMEDQKSWVNKEVPRRDFELPKTKFEYNELVDKVVSAKHDFSPQEAYNKIIEIEKKYDYHFFGCIYPDEQDIKLVFERRRLAALEELNLLAEKEKQVLAQLRGSFEQVIAEILETAGSNAAEIQKNIDVLLISDTAKNLSEVKKIMIEGPIVEGFEDTPDPIIPNSFISEFLQDTFTLASLKKAKVGRISKDDKYLIILGKNLEKERVDELLQKGIVHFGTASGMVLAEDKEKYLQAEMFLEGEDDSSKLKHTFKVRATAGNSNIFGKIQLRSFGVEKSEDFDYLADIRLDSEEEKIKAYILGTIVHEIAHRYQDQLEKKEFDDYKQIIEEEMASQRSKFVSDYVVRHYEVYGSDDWSLLKEDFAESVRIYTTNPDYLRNNYPRRLAFIEQNFPFIKSGSIIEAIKRQ